MDVAVDVAWGCLPWACSPPCDRCKGWTPIILASEQGGLEFAEGISAPGSYVEMLARMDVLVLISNCPQLNNPCSGFNPTPIEVLVWDE